MKKEQKVQAILYDNTGYYRLIGDANENLASDLPEIIILGEMYFILTNNVWTVDGGARLPVYRLACNVWKNDSFTLKESD